MFLAVAGFFQSCVKCIVWRPDVVFAKGGFVSVPAGVAARLFRIPLVIHDSDSHPGFANRMLARFAAYIATGAPLDNYPYDRKKAQYTGIPVGRDFRAYTDKERKRMKIALGFKPNRPLVVITGGGLGAGHVNDAVAKVLGLLLERASVMLLAGVEHYGKARTLVRQNDGCFQLLPFINSDKMAQALGAADIVVSRAGATTILELSALAKPTILIPASHLTAGHQLKNAAEYAKDGAAKILSDEDLRADPQLLVDMVYALLDSPKMLRKMGRAFHAFSQPGAAKEVAALIERAAEIMSVR